MTTANARLQTGGWIILVSVFASLWLRLWRTKTGSSASPILSTWRISALYNGSSVSFVTLTR